MTSAIRDASVSRQIPLVAAEEATIAAVSTVTGNSAEDSVPATDNDAADLNVDNEAVKEAAANKTDEEVRNWAWDQGSSPLLAGMLSIQRALMACAPHPWLPSIEQTVSCAGASPLLVPHPILQPFGLMHPTNARLGRRILELPT